MPVVPQTPELVEKLGDLLWRQHGGRLVHNQNGDISIQQLEDLHLLARRHGDIPHNGIHLQIEVKLLDARLDPAAGFFLVNAPKQPDRLNTQDSILPDSVFWDEDDLLVDHTYAIRHRHPRVMENHLLTAIENSAGVGWLHAVEDFHQRRFPGAILPHNGVNLTLIEINA